MIVNLVDERIVALQQFQDLCEGRECSISGKENEVQGAGEQGKMWFWNSGDESGKHEVIESNRAVKLVSKYIISQRF